MFAETDELRDQRQELLDYRALFVKILSSSAVNAAILPAFTEACESLDAKNSERFASKLLYMLTRNTGFETDKAKLGECFINHCCEWRERQSDDICGLDAHRINAKEKAILLMERSALKKAFEGVGLKYDNNL